MQRTAPVADRLWREHGDDLVRYATALVGPDDALDVVAETFVRIVAMRPDQLDAIRDARSYLHRMVLNDARMMRRSESRREGREWRANNDRPEAAWIDIDAMRPLLLGLSVRQRAAYPLYVPEGLELGFAASTIPGAQRVLLFEDPAEPRASGRSVTVTITAGGPMPRTDLVPVELATGDTWETRPEGGLLRFVLDGGSVEISGANLTAREVEDVAASLTVVTPADLPRPVIDLFEDELVTVAEATVDERRRMMHVSTDGVSYGWTVANRLFRSGGRSCCARLRPGESIVVTGAQGPNPQRLEADGVADFVVEGLLSPEVAEVRIETDDGFAATVPAQELSGTFGVRFLLAAIPIADGAVVTGTATALDATGAELGVAGFEMRGE